MNQTLIYASPATRKPNIVKYASLYLYTYKYSVEYGNGMLVIAARNPMVAMDIVRKRLSPMSIECSDCDLEHLVGATYEGSEGIKAEQSYYE